MKVSEREEKGMEAGGRQKREGKVEGLQKIACQVISLSGLAELYSTLPLPKRPRPDLQDLDILFNCPVTRTSPGEQSPSIPSCLPRLPLDRFLTDHPTISRCCTSSSTRSYTLAYPIEQATPRTVGSVRPTRLLAQLTRI